MKIIVVSYNIMTYDLYVLSSNIILRYTIYH